MRHCSIFVGADAKSAWVMISILIFPIIEIAQKNYKAASEKYGTPCSIGLLAEETANADWRQYSQIG